MKLKTIILVAVAAFIFFSCYPLVAPVGLRVNPNDGQNYIPVAENFTVTYDDGNSTVSFDWTTLNPDYDYKRDGYIMIRQIGGAPVSIYDGYPVELPWGTDDSGGAESVDTDTGDGIVTGAQAGYVNYYGLFAFWKEDENTETIEIQTNEDGSRVLYNTDGYVFSGPVVASVGVPATVTIEAAVDKHITSADQWFNDHVLALSVDNAYMPTSHGCIWFDLDTADIAGATITGARLYLMNDNPFNTDYSVQVRRITSDWGDNSTWAEVNDDPNFITMENGFEFPVGNTDNGADNFFEGEALLNIVQFWFDGGTNNGLRLTLEDSAATMTAYTAYFKTSEAGTMFGPRLEMIYYIE